MRYADQDVLSRTALKKKRLGKPSILKGVRQCAARLNSQLHIKLDAYLFKDFFRFFLGIFFGRPFSSFFGIVFASAALILDDCMGKTCKFDLF